MTTLDDDKARLAALEKALLEPAQVTSGGRTVQYATNQQKLEAIRYLKQKIADAESAAGAATAGCSRAGRQVRVVYGGRGY